MKEWRDASALIASIHGRLGIRIDGQINHAHAHLNVSPVSVPEAALGPLAQLRRDVLVARRDGALANPEPTPAAHAA